jgi:ABC-2 type transport system permease protein
MPANQRLRRATGWRLFLRTVQGRAYPRVVGAQRQFWGLVVDIFLPFLAVCAYVFLYRSLRAPEAFVGFVILGGAMIAFWLNVLWSMANQLFWEKETGNLALYVVAPGSLMAILLGMAIGGIVVASLRAFVIVAIGSWLFGVHYAVASVRLLVIVFISAVTALYALGMVFASIFLRLGREGWHYVNIAQEPVYLISGMYFPVKSLNFWVAAGASVLPLTLALDATRQLALPGGAATGFLPIRTEISGLVAMGALFLVAARISLTHMERLAIRDGKLTESRG